METLRAAMDIKVTSRIVNDPRRVVWLTEDLSHTAYRATDDWTNFVGATFESVDFRGSVFRPFNAQGATFIACDFSGIRVKSGSLGIMKGGIQSLYRGCSFDNADLRGSTPHDARFERCTFRNAKLEGWDALLAEFVDCVFEGRLRGVRFAGTPELSSIEIGRRMNQFHGNDFTKADLIDVEFTCGIDIAANRMPSGPDYLVLDRLHERVARAEREVATWSDPEDRRLGLAYLRIYRTGGYRNQSVLFERRDGIASKSPEIRNRLVALLAAPLD